MLRTKRANEGYVLIDHRDSPGLSEPDRLAAGLSPLMPIGKGQRLEAATFTCSHCDRIVIMNPLRNRARGYCCKCDHDICDRCEAKRVVDGECHERAKRIAQFMARADGRSW